MSDQLQPIVDRYRPLDELLPAHWRQGDLDAGEVQLHYYRTGGEGPPLLLLHGFMEGALAWLSTARELERDFDLILLDTRGHGDSDGIESGFTQSQLTADVAGAIRALGIAPALVLGFSQGGTTAIHLADEYPGLVRALVVTGWAEPTGMDVSASPEYQAWFRSFLTWLETLRGQEHAARLRTGLQQLRGPLLSEDDYVTWIECSARLDPAMVEHGNTMWAGLSDAVDVTREALSRLTRPTLVLKSAFFPTPGAAPGIREEASELPFVRILEFTHTGHHIHRERPDDFLREVRAFLTGVGG